MKGILPLFSETHTVCARNSEKFFNPHITSVKVSVNGIPNKVYSQDVEALDMWNEVIGHFGKYDANDHLTSYMNATKFYTEDKVGQSIDLRSMSDHEMHSKGLKMMITKD